MGRYHKISFWEVRVTAMAAQNGGKNPIVWPLDGAEGGGKSKWRQKESAAERKEKFLSVSLPPSSNDLKLQT